MSVWSKWTRCICKDFSFSFFCFLAFWFRFDVDRIRIRTPRKKTGYDSDPLVTPGPIRFCLFLDIFLWKVTLFYIGKINSPAIKSLLSKTGFNTYLKKQEKEGKTSKLYFVLKIKVRKKNLSCVCTKYRQILPKRLKFV